MTDIGTCFRDASIEKLLNSNFISEYTDFPSLVQMFTHVDCPIRGLEDLNEVPRKALDSFISEHSEFSTWEELLGNARCYLINEEYGMD